MFCIVCRLYGMYLAKCSLYAMLKSVLYSKCYAFWFMYCHSCALVGLFLDAYDLCDMHWLSVEHTSVLPCAC